MQRPQSWRYVALGYITAVLAVLATCLLRHSLDWFIGADTPLIIIYLIPVVFVAWFWGNGPATLAVILSGVVGDITLHNPNIPTSAKILRLGSWILVGMLVATMVHARKRIEDISAEATHFPDELSARLAKDHSRQLLLGGWAWLLNVLVIGFLFASYEIIKELTHPQLTKWESHLMSIVVVTIIVSVVLYRSRSMIQAQMDTIAAIATRLRDRETEARKLIAVTSEMSHGVIIMDPHGHAEWTNASCTRITGYNLEELKGRCPMDLLAGPETHPDTLRIIHEKMNAGEQFEIEAVNYAKDARKFWVLHRFHPVRDGDGAITSYVSITEDVTDKRDMWERIRASEQRARLIIDTAMDAVVLVDARGSITGWNPQAQSIFGRGRSQAIGMPIGPLAIAQEDRAAVLAILHECRTADQAQHAACARRIEITGIRADDSRFAAELSVSALGDNPAMGFSLFIRDISLDKQRQQELLLAKEAAEHGNRAKSEFLATMSHELRTPLNGVTGLADLLEHTTLTPQQARYVKIIQSSSDSLLSIINQVLDFSKIEAGKLELAPRTFDLPEAVEEVIAILAQKAAAKGLELACQIDPAVPLRVHGDDDRLRQVLMNITNNAIKFTAQGEVVVRVALLTEPPTPAGLTVLHFTVTDTGPGIPHERLSRLFKCFSQVDSSVTRQFGGTGLGLAISKQLVNLMGGDIGVRSTPGQGSTFWFTVRLGLAETTPRPAAPFDLSGRRVLVVDDNQTQCQVLQEQLQTWGLQAATATSAGLALDLLSSAAAQARPFDLAILDLCMPGMGGLELGRTLRASPKLANIPLILMSGIEASAAAEESRLGQFLNKPIRQSSLLDAVMKVFVQPTLHAPYAPPSLAPSPADAPALKSPKAIRILLAEDMEVNQFVVTETLARACYTCDIVSNGRQAVDAAAAKDYDIILMDCQMPEMSGFEATAAIRARQLAQGPSAHRATIIALTANAVKGDRERCLAVGMDDYLTKPLNPAKLIRCLETHSPSTPPSPPAPSPPSAAARADALPSAEVLPANAPAPLDNQIINPADLLARCDGDQVMMARLIEMFQQKSRQTWDSLLASYQAHDAPATTRFAHALKGTAANLSALKVSDLAARLEHLGRSAQLDAADDLVKELGEQLEICRNALSTLTRSQPASISTPVPAN